MIDNIILVITTFADAITSLFAFLVAFLSLFFPSKTKIKICINKLISFLSRFQTK